MKSLVDRSLLVEGESGVNLSRNLARNDLEDLLAELHEEAVQCSIDLLVDVLAVLLSVCNSLIDELGVFGLLRGGEDQRWVGGGILWLVLANGSKVTRVADDSLSLNQRLFSYADVDWQRVGRVTYGASGLELVEG